MLGCSGEFDYGSTGTVKGRLTMDGKPLKPGTAVTLMQPDSGYLAFGTTDAEGNFEVKSWNEGHMPIGTYRVMIQPPAGDSPDPESAEAAELALSGGGGADKAEFPERYRQTTTSGLTYEVKEGENHFEIDLKSAPSKST